MDKPVSRDIPLDEKGNIDVLEELEILKDFKRYGVDITEMEELLFTDIEEYRSRRSRILDLVEDEELLVGTDYGISPIGDQGQLEQSDDDFNTNLVGSPLQEEGSFQDQDDDLLDLSEENVDEEPVQSSPMMPIDPSSISETEIFSEKKEDLDTSKGNTPDVHQDDLLSDQEEALQDEPLKKGTRDPSNSSKPLIIAVSLVALIIILGSIGYYMTGRDIEPDEVQELSADFSISDLNPIAGHIVNLTSDMGSDDVSYEWDIIPGYYQVHKGTSTSRYLEVYFKRPVEYRIDLTVSAKEDSRTRTEFLTVSNLDLGISRERFDDVYNYDISGELYMKNIERFFDEPEASSLEDIDIEYWTEPNNPMKIEIDESKMKIEDGLASSFDRSLRITEQFLKFSGTVSDRDGPTTTISGSSSTVQRSYIDMYSKRPVRSSSDVVLDFVIPINTFTLDKRIEQNIDMFPDLSNEFSDLRIEDLSIGRNFSIGDKGTTRWGSVLLSWEAESADRFLNRPTIKLVFEMDDSVMRSMDLDHFKMEHWIDDIVPVPVRSRLNVSSEPDLKNPYSMDHEQKLIEYYAGDNMIIYGSQDSKHEIFGSIGDKHEAYRDDLHDNWEIIPHVGSFGGTFNDQNDPEGIVGTIETKPSFKTWYAENEDAFVVYSSLGSNSTATIWDLSFSEKGEKWGYNATVINEVFKGVIRRVEPVDIDRDEIPEVMTFSGAESAFKLSLKRIDPDAAISIYGKSSPDDDDEVLTDLFTVGTRIDHDYPVIGLFNPYMYSPLEMCMEFRSNDGDLTIGLDMTNGQIAYVQRTDVSDN